MLTSFRNLLAEKGIEAVIPSIRRRKPLIPHDIVAYRDRNLIERMYSRLGLPACRYPLRQARETSLLVS